MKVLQINAVYNLSSTGRTTTELHLAMLNKGIDSYVAYSKQISRATPGFTISAHRLT